jgi:hypothetical protein
VARDFWRNSGFHLLERDASGCLAITDDFLRAYYLRPEIRPVDESCAGEIALHRALMAQPRMPVEAAQLETVADTDARANYRILLDFRARLMAAPSLEACYSELFAGARVDVPPLFIDQLAQIILRNVLEDCADALEPRAAELFYREQKASLQDGIILLADLETINMHAAAGAGAGLGGGLGQLIAEAQAPFAHGQAPREPVSLEVLDRANADLYWLRDQRHDFVISLNHDRPAAAAFCRVLERWILHLSGVQVRLAPVPRIEDPEWAWHIGLDAQSTALLNDLWRGETVAPERLARLLALFRMEFADAADMRADVAGKPVYLALSMGEDEVVRMKPQNLLLNLPLARAA